MTRRPDPRAAGGRSRRRSAPEWALLGAGLSTGWIAYDLAVFATAGDPVVALAIVPGSLVAVAVGAAVGAAAAFLPALLAPLALAAAAGLLARDAAVDLLGLRGPFFLTPFCLMSLGWILAFALVALLRRFLSIGPFSAGLCGGALACIAVARWRMGELPALAWPIGVSALGCLALLSVRWPRPVLRLAACAALLLWPAYQVAKEGYGPTRISWYGRDDLPPGPAAPAAPGGAVSPNLVLIVLDTVRADHLASYGHERDTMPRLERFTAAHATRYSSSRSTSPYTLSSHASLFTGLFPAEHGAARLKPTALPLKEGVTTLAERLRERGYHTAAVVSNGTYLTHRLGIDRGFERFDNRKGSFVRRYLALAQATGAATWAGHLTYRDGRSITDEALEWLTRERRPGPFFLMLNYLDAHEPYLPPSPENGAFGDERPAFPMTPERELRELQYDRNLLYLDRQVGRLLEGLEEQGLFENTVIVVTSDHGEAFGEHGLYEHCWTLYEEVVNVPLFVKPKGGRRVEVDPTPIDGADVHWLMLSELGIEYERPPTLEGLFGEWYRQIPVVEKYATFAERTNHDIDQDLIAWMEGDRKVIVSTNDVVEVYDIAQDPGEQNPLEITEEERKAALSKAGAWWYENPVSVGEAEDLDEDELGRLKALGYMGDAEEGDGE